jgi:hypothetical protein
MHCGHADQCIKDISLGELTLDGDSKVVIQRNNNTSTTFLWSESGTLSAGGIFISGQEYKLPPATYIIPSFLPDFHRGTKDLPILKLAKYWTL